MVAAVGGTTQLADLLAYASSSTAKPLVRVVQQTVQSIANSTTVALTFGAGSEEIDTDGWHDTSVNTSRITPLKAGYVRLTGTVFFPTTTTITVLRACIGKNGTILSPYKAEKPSTTSQVVSAQISMLQQCNGSTDYFELFALQSSGAAVNTSTGAGVSSVLELEFLRPL
jgi:hypothetical protein